MLNDNRLPSRFWSKVSLEPNTGCWLWTGTLRNGDGYGCFRLSKKDFGTRRLVQAHRLCYQQLVGPIPTGLTLDHLCRARRCVNPAHLEPVTNAENIGRGNAGWRGAKTHCPKGHPYAGDNLITRPQRSGAKGFSRECRECYYAQNRARYARRKARHSDSLR